MCGCRKDGSISGVHVFDAFAGAKSWRQLHPLSYSTGHCLRCLRHASRASQEVGNKNDAPTPIQQICLSVYSLNEVDSYSRRLRECIYYIKRIESCGCSYIHVLWCIPSARLFAEYLYVREHAKSGGCTEDCGWCIVAEPGIGAEPMS
jgi:hypothetical protein